MPRVKGGHLARSLFRPIWPYAHLGATCTGDATHVPRPRSDVVAAALLASPTVLCRWLCAVVFCWAALAPISEVQSSPRRIRSRPRRGMYGGFGFWVLRHCSGNFCIPQLDVRQVTADGVAVVVRPTGHMVYFAKSAYALAGGLHRSPLGSRAPSP